jgi:hypothetical protein
MFGWSSNNVIKRTFDVTTQFGRSIPTYSNMRMHYKSRFPAMNVVRRKNQSQQIRYILMFLQLTMVPKLLSSLLDVKH